MKSVVRAVVGVLVCTSVALAAFQQTLTNPPPLSCSTAACEAPANATNCAGRNAFAGYTGDCGNGGGHALFSDFTAAEPYGWGADRWVFTVDQGATTGRFETYGNNVGDYARLYGEVVVPSQPTNMFDVVVELVKVSRQVATNYHVKNELDSRCSLANVNDLGASWEFYALRTDQPSYLKGKGKWAGLTVTLGLERMNMYPFLVGKGASQKNLEAGVSTWIAYNGFTYDDTLWKASNPSRPHLDFRITTDRMKEGDINVNVECPCQCNPPTTNVCGNNIVEAPEQCDGGECCNSDCTFSSSTKVCREADGECDVQETCSGSSSTCPTDTFSPSTQACEETVGFCDVRIQNTCPGNAPVCHGPPTIKLDQWLYPWENFNVISFKDYYGANGDVEGRLAVQRNLVLDGGFSVGFVTDTTATGHDNFVPFAVVVGHNASWVSGSVWPDGSNNPNPSIIEEIFVGDTFTAPDYLKMRLGSLSTVIGDKDAEFEAARVYFTELQSKFTAIPSNVEVTSQYGGLFLKCNDYAASFYSVSIDGAALSAANWFNLENCNLLASYVLNIGGTGSVLLQGGNFPSVIERVVYNILGSDRYINVTTGIAGNILAPNNILYQTNGVTRGLVVVGNVLATVQNNKPNCESFEPIVIAGRTAGPIQAANRKRSVMGNDDEQTLVPVHTFGSFAINDVVSFGNNDESEIQSGVMDENGNLYLLVAPALTGTYGEGQPFQAIIQNPSSVTSRAQIQAEDMPSGAAVVSVAVAAVAAAAVVVAAF